MVTLTSYASAYCVLKVKKKGGLTLANYSERNVCLWTLLNYEIHDRPLVNSLVTMYFYCDCAFHDYEGLIGNSRQLFMKGIYLHIWWFYFLREHVIHINLRKVNVLFFYPSGPYKDPRKSRVPLIVPNNKGKQGIIEADKGSNGDLCHLSRNQNVHLRDCSIRRLTEIDSFKIMKTRDTLNEIERNLHNAMALAEDIVVVVAIFAKIESDIWSKTLKHLGLETTLASVCSMYGNINAMMKYDLEGKISNYDAFHGIRSSIGGIIIGHLVATYLEDLRPFVKEFGSNSLQTKLVVLNPRLCPDYVVKMIHLDLSKLSFFIARGHDHSGTFFCGLLSHLYSTNEEMLDPLLCINDDAISLDDGGIVLGRRNDVTVNFLLILGVGSYTISYLLLLNVVHVDAQSSTKHLQLAVNQFTLVAISHRKMIYMERVHAPRVLLKWKTLPPKHGTCICSSLRTKIFEQTGIVTG